MWSRWGRSRTVTCLPPSPVSSQPTTRAVERVDVVLDDDHRRGLGRELDDLALADAVAGDVDPLAVDLDQPVADELAGLRAGAGPAGAVHDVVEAPLEQAAAGSRPSGPAGARPPRRCCGTAARARRRCTSPSASPAAGRGTREPALRRRVRPCWPGGNGRRSSARRPFSFSKMLVPRRRETRTFGPV